MEKKSYIKDSLVVNKNVQIKENLDIDKLINSKSDINCSFQSIIRC